MSQRAPTGCFWIGHVPRCVLRDRSTIVRTHSMKISSFRRKGECPLLMIPLHERKSHRPNIPHFRPHNWNVSRPSATPEKNNNRKTCSTVESYSNGTEERKKTYFRFPLAFVSRTPYNTTLSAIERGSPLACFCFRSQAFPA